MVKTSQLLAVLIAMTMAAASIAAPQTTRVDQSVENMIAKDDVKALKTWINAHPEEARKKLNSRSGLLDFATQHASVEVTRLLIEIGANIHNYWGYQSPFSRAKTVPMLELLLESGAPKDHRLLDDKLEATAQRIDYHNRYAFRNRYDLPDTAIAITTLRRQIQLLRDHGAQYSIEAAAYLGDLELVKRLDRSASNDPKSYPLGSDDEKTPALKAFHIAVGSCHTEIVEYFLSKGFDPNQWVGSGLYYPAITYACEHRNEACLQALLDAGANPNVVVFENCQGGGSGPPYEFDGYRPLDIVLLQRGPLAMTKLLVNHGASVAPDPNSRSNPLISAIKRANVEAVRYLIGNGADTSHPRAINLSALMRLEKAHLVQDFSFYYGRYDSKHGAGAISTDVVNGRQLELVDRDFDGDGEIDGQSSPDLGYRFTPLQVAADLIGTGNKHYEFGASVYEFQNPELRKSSLATAAAAAQIITLIRDAGAKDDLYTAVSLDDPLLIERLLKNGQEWSIPNWRDALMNRAVELGNVAALNSLLNNGFDPNSLGPDVENYHTKAFEDGDSILTRAVHSGHLDVIDLLLRAGANPSGAGQRELTNASDGPLSEAAWSDHNVDYASAIELILQHECPKDEVTRVMIYLDEQAKFWRSRISEKDRVDYSKLHDAIRFEHVHAILKSHSEK